MNKLKYFLLIVIIAFHTNIIAAPPTQKLQGSPINVPLIDIQRFATAIALIKHFYIKPVNDKTLFDNAIKGLLSNLDPHSSYLSKSDLKELKTVTTGKFGGIGIEVIPEEGAMKIITPLDDSPASRAGIKAGDLIVRINNKLVKDMTINEAIKTMRGPAGSKIKLTILRKNAKNRC